MVCTHERPGATCLTAFFLTMVFFGSISQIHAQDAAKGHSMLSTEQLAKANLTYKVIPAEGGGYGYDVFANGRRVIHQTTIPGQPGISGFESESDSKKV